jgi:hypothetical protein
MVGAALKVVNKGESAMNFGSGVGFFDPEVLTLTLTLSNPNPSPSPNPNPNPNQMLIDHTKGLRCPLPADYWKPAPAADPISDTETLTETKVPAWIIAVVVLACVLCLFVTAALGFVYHREKKGKPVFMTLDEPMAPTTKQASPA